jgi:hypothetical protein
MPLSRVSLFSPNQTALAVEIDTINDVSVCAVTLVQIRGEHIVNVAASRATAARVIATVIRHR